MKSRLYASAAAFACSLSMIVPTATAQTDSRADTSRDDEIVITASPIARDKPDVIIGASVVSKEKLAERMAGTIGEVIKYEPGVSSTFFGPGASRPIIRGQGGNRVSILTNGLGALDASTTSPDHAVSVEPATAERVEIIRGSGTLRYGSAAAGGVVNIIDNRIKDHLPDEAFNAAIRLSATSVDEGREVAGASDFTLYDQGDTGIVLHVDGVYRESSDYNIPGFAKSARLRLLEGDTDPATKSLDNSATEITSYGAALSYIAGLSHVGVSVKRNQTTYGVPGGEEDVSIDLEQTRTDVIGAIELPATIFEKLQFAMGYGDYQHQEIEDDGAVGTTFNNQSFEGRVELLHKPIAGFKGAIGLQYLNRDFSAIGDEAFTPPTKTKQTGVFIFEEYDLGDWLLEGGARVEKMQHTNIASSEKLDFTAASVSAGLIRRIDENASIGVSIFRNERAPAVEELFSNGSHLATRQYEIGDATLGLETATGIEASLKMGDERTDIQVNLFLTNYDNYIFENPTGAVIDDLPVFQFVAEDAQFRGFEAEMNRRIGALGAYELSGQATLGYVEAFTKGENGADLPRIPPLAGLVGLEADNGRLSVRGEIDWASAQNAVAANELPSDSYAVVNMFATIKPWAENQNLKLRLALLNITDEEVRQHASPLKEYVPLPGRNVRLSLEASF